MSDNTTKETYQLNLKLLYNTCYITPQKTIFVHVTSRVTFVYVVILLWLNNVDESVFSCVTRMISTFFAHSSSHLKTEYAALLLISSFPFMWSADSDSLQDFSYLPFLPVDHVPHVTPQEAVSWWEVWWPRTPGPWTKTSTMPEVAVSVKVVHKIR